MQGTWGEERVAEGCARRKEGGGATQLKLSWATDTDT